MHPSLDVRENQVRRHDEAKGPNVLARQQALTS